MSILLNPLQKIVSTSGVSAYHLSIILILIMFIVMFIGLFLGQELAFVLGAFCAAQWPPVRLPVATRRCQWPGLISHFSFNHNDVVFRHPLEQRVG